MQWKDKSSETAATSVLTLFEVRLRFMAFFFRVPKTGLQVVLEPHAAGAVGVLFLPLWPKMRRSPQLWGLLPGCLPPWGDVTCCSPRERGLLPTGDHPSVLPSRSGRWLHRCPASSLALHMESLLSGKIKRCINEI